MDDDDDDDAFVRRKVIGTVETLTLQIEIEVRLRNKGFNVS